MKIIIVGIGKVGETLCGLLSNEGHDIIVIDTDYKIIDRTVNLYDVIGIKGNGATFKTLTEAEANNCDMFIACTESDELNIMSCTVAQKLGATSTVARVRNPEYHEQVRFLYEQMGINLIINPEFETALEIEKLTRFPAATKLETFAKGRVDMAQIKISNEHKLVGKALYELRNVFNSKFLICAVKRNDEVYIPSGNFVINANDTVYFTAPHEQMGSVFKELGLIKKKIKSVMIIGGGKISFYLAQRLLKLKISVTMVEIDKTRCENLAALLPEATIINADGTDSDVLIEEGIDGVDALISLTDIDEENIIVSMFAGSRNVDKIITKVTRQSLIQMLEHTDIAGSTVSPMLTTANSILSYARAKNNASGGTIKTLYRIVDEKVEAIEFQIEDGFKFFNTPLKNMSLKKNILIACILRDNKIIHPNGDTQIHPNDRVVIVTASEQLSDINDIFA